MLTRKEYEDTYVRMMNSLRDKDYKGRKNCNYVVCKDCPLKGFCDDNSSSKKYRVFDLIEIVEKWGKEHPIITRADKYKEVFGIGPIFRDGIYICPGEAIKDCGPHYSCNECKEQYWNEEYVEPKKEN